MSEENIEYNLTRIDLPKESDDKTADIWTLFGAGAAFFTGFVNNLAWIGAVLDLITNTENEEKIIGFSPWALSIGIVFGIFAAACYARANWVIDMHYQPEAEAISSETPQIRESDTENPSEETPLLRQSPSSSQSINAPIETMFAPMSKKRKAANYFILTGSALTQTTNRSNTISATSILALQNRLARKWKLLIYLGSAVFGAIASVAEVRIAYRKLFQNEQNNSSDTSEKDDSDFWTKYKLVFDFFIILLNNIAWIASVFDLSTNAPITRIGFSYPALSTALVLGSIFSIGGVGSHFVVDNHWIEDNKEKAQTLINSEQFSQLQKNAKLTMLQLLLLSGDYISDVAEFSNTLSATIILVIMMATQNLFALENLANIWRLVIFLITAVLGGLATVSEVRRSYHQMLENNVIEEYQEQENERAEKTCINNPFFQKIHSFFKGNHIVEIPVATSTSRMTPPAPASSS